MGDVIPFKRKPLKEVHKGKGLCRSGFHRWKVKIEKQFDVKRGKLVTLFECARCGEQKTELL